MSQYINLTYKEKKLIRKELLDKLDEAFIINDNAQKGIPIHKVLFFILDKFNTGGYHGNIDFRIMGNQIHDPKEQEVTHKLDTIYNYDEEV
jgi:hypothetical protein